MNIKEFLLARITEDELMAINASRSVNSAKSGNGDASAGTKWTSKMGMVEGEHLGDWGDSNLWDCEGAASLCVAEQVADHMARHDPARVLAECRAKRAIVAMAADEGGYVKVGDWESCSDSCPEVIASEAIRAIAAVYADHSDYQAEWGE